MLLRNGTSEEYYYYIYNAQGDVIGILDSTGTQVVEYTYSAWGEILGFCKQLLTEKRKSYRSEKLCGTIFVYSIDSTDNI